MDFADGGWANVEQHMRVNFEAPVRLVEALLPLLRRTAATAGAVAGRAGGSESGGDAQPGQPATFAGRPLKAPVAIVNVTSTAARIARRGTGGYSAARCARRPGTILCIWRSGVHGVHVGNVLPGFISTEGFPQAELRARALTRWAVSEPEGRGRGDPRGRTGRQGRALRAALLLGGAAAAADRSRSGAPLAPSSDVVATNTKSA